MGVRSGLAQLGEHRDTSYLCDHCIPQRYLGLRKSLFLVKRKTNKLYCIKVKENEERRGNQCSRLERVILINGIFFENPHVDFTSKKNLTPWLM
jgi:hypothetical protein